MTAYKDIVGQKITKVSSDPSNVKTGQMFYNTSTNQLKALAISEAWSSAPPLSQSRDSAGGAGIQTAAMIFGGRNEVDGGPTGGPNAQYNLTEEYNGTGYSTGGALVQGRQAMAGAGTQTAGLGVGGYHPPAPGPKSLVEEYDGSSWSEVTNQPTATFGQGSAGTQTAAVVFGGRTAGGWVASTYEYDGTNWTTGGALGTARVLKGAATGTQTAALAVGGDLTPPGSATNKVEEYNGSSFSEVNAYPSNIQTNMVSGIQTSALSFGGNIPPYTTNAFKYDGTSFTATESMGSSASGQNTLKTATDNSTGLSMGGYGTSSYIATSEEFTSSTNTITAAAWASSNNLNTGRNAGAGFGIQTAAVMTTGNVPPESNATEEYDGSSWTSVTNYPISKRFTAASGTLTSGLVAGGSPAVATVNKYDGTNWTAANSLPTSTDGGVMFGTQTASVYSVGRNPSATTTTYEFDGTNWTAGGAAGTARYFLASSGTLTAGLMFGGQAPGPSTKSETEEYDGTSWSESGDLGTARYGVGGSLAGTQTDTIAFAGNNPAVVLTEGYDGTVWSTRPNMGTARRFISGAGTATAALGFGGNPPNTSTEEFTGETTAVNLKAFG